MEIRTLNDIYAATCQIDRPAALKSKRDGRWVDVTVPEFRDAVRHFATGLRLLGIKPGDRVAILSENRPEWAIADFAILANAAISVPIYPTLLGWQIEYLLNDSGSVAVICSTPEQLQKVQEIRSHTPHVHNVIVCDPPTSVPPNVLTFQKVVESGRKNPMTGASSSCSPSRSRATWRHSCTPPGPPAIRRVPCSPTAMWPAMRWPR
jgi:long-chain acyl-CoA synthetase